MRSFLSITLLLTPAASIGFAQPKQPDAKGVEFFEKKIRPVLAEHCYGCHSQEAQKTKKLRGDLLLDSKAGMLKGGVSGAAIVPGKAQESLLLKALRHQGDIKMPRNGKLADDVIADFAKWVDLGAPDPRDGVAIAKRTIDIEAGKKYWAFAPLGAATLPQVNNGSWARTPLDRFILAKLEEKKLTPNTSAGKEKLIRRAYLDLVGFPPTTAELDAFIKDTAPDAYDRLIDRLLASEHYGERWARHWLDVVRFAESGGYEFDGDRRAAYHYRDFVIKALNQDMPYDQFVRWQVAGDHLAPDNLQAVAATGFLVAGPYPGQTTSKTLELIRYNHLDDMLSTLGSSVLGLSVGCARCHEHKYDPIPQEDYYRLLACLGRTDSAELKIDPNPETYKKAKAEYDVAHAPFLAARDKFEKESTPVLLKKWSEVAKKKNAPWLILDELIDPTKQKAGNGAVNTAGKAEAFKLHEMVAYSYLKDITGIRIEGSPQKFQVLELKVKAKELKDKGKEMPIKVKAVNGAADPVAAALFEVEGLSGFDGGTALTFTFKYKGEFSTPFKLSVTTTSRPVKPVGDSIPQKEGELLVLLDKEKGQLTPKNRAGVIHWLRKLEAEADKVYGPEAEHAKKEPQPNLVPVFAAQSGRGGDVYHLIRGEVARKNGVVQPGFMQVLMTDQDQRWTGQPATKQPATKQPAATPPRVALATWLTDTEKGAGNLAARVIVNRLWQHHLGRGIVGTANDFGVQGDPPSHPELLDYLARELIKNGWKLKPIHKLIMTSAVYQECGDATPANLQADPQNRLFWRRPARRLEAEAIRDSLLAASGTLDKTMYGPGTLDGNNARRSVYLTVKRSQMVPFLQMFDVPEGMQSIGERSTTTVATQSLAFLNSPFVRQRAEKLAQRIRPKSLGDLPQAIDEAYLTALSRRPTTEERDRMIAFVNSQTQGTAPAARPIDQALTDVCQVILCLNEFVYVD